MEDLEPEVQSMLVRVFNETISDKNNETRLSELYSMEEAQYIWLYFFQSEQAFKSALYAKFNHHNRIELMEKFNKFLP